MIHISLAPVLGDPGYESRAIVNDAKRAAKMGDKIEKSCFWEKGTPQYALWYRTFIDAGGRDE